MRVRRFLIFLLLCVLTVSSACAGADDGTIRSWDKEEKWQYIQLGQYMYEEDGAMAPVLWRVLYVENGKALIITEHVIDLVQPHHMESQKDYDYYKDVKHKGRLKPVMKLYEDTEIPEWFDNVMWPVLIGDDPIGAAFVDEGLGRLFCMTKEEWSRQEYGFPKKSDSSPNPARIAYVTPYVKVKRMYDWSKPMVTIEKGIVGSCYWTSTMRPGNRQMQIVGINGHLSWGGVIRPNVGIRPAAKVDLSMLEIASGSGTEDDPYVMQSAGN
ncbi:MAG: hypothetical protein IJI38_08860 [Clostridia bacterium]|nr:hypothetical protein [Clostridia bacterium]